MESSGASVPQAAPRQGSALPMVGGVLLLIAGIISLIIWIYYAFVVGSASSIFSMIPGGTEFGQILMICGIIGIIFSIIALLGGIMAIQRKMWGLALAGSILGLFTIGFLFTSSILSLIALILIGISRQDFK